VYLK
jgi:dynein regulatory complex protein 1